jgi:hypothetical protein
MQVLTFLDFFVLIGEFVITKFESMVFFFLTYYCQSEFQIILSSSDLNKPLLNIIQNIYKSHLIRANYFWTYSKILPKLSVSNIPLLSNVKLIWYQEFILNPIKNHQTYLNRKKTFEPFWTYPTLFVCYTTFMKCALNQYPKF